MTFIRLTDIEGNALYLNAAAIISIARLEKPHVQFDERFVGMTGVLSAVGASGSWNWVKETPTEVTTLAQGFYWTVGK
jgi:hypothetical protein